MADQANEALSVLNRMEQEAHSWELQRSALKDVRKVIEAYTVASKGLSELEKVRADLEASIAGLGPRYEEQNDVLRRDVSGARRDADEEIAAIRSRVAEARKEKAEIEDNLARTREQAALQIADLDHDIKVREDEIERLSADLEALKTKHGLSV